MWNIFLDITDSLKLHRTYLGREKNILCGIVN